MSPSVLTALLGFRQAQIMRHLWAHGPATVRELHTALGPEMSYNTFLMICRRLVEKGVLERRRVTEARRRDNVAKQRRSIARKRQMSGDI